MVAKSLEASSAAARPARNGWLPRLALAGDLGVADLADAVPSIAPADRDGR